MTAGPGDKRGYLAVGLAAGLTWLLLAVLFRTAGVLLVVLPLAFNLCFLLLARRFDYPDILRRPTSALPESSAAVY